MTPIKTFHATLILGLLGLGSCVSAETPPEETPTEAVTEAVTEVPTESTPPEEPETPEILPEDTLTDEGKIDLPFYTQAPFSNWDYPWQEACEEASIALVANLYLEKNWSREEFNEELLRLVDWEMEVFGAYEHTSVEQTVLMISENYGLETRIVKDPSIEDLQKSIHAGNLIVAPFAGKFLGNPNFTNGGPVYHMLVITGYDLKKNEVITHDVGTRKGEDYVYSWETIANALHDWNDSNILEGTAQWIEVLAPSE